MPPNITPSALKPATSCNIIQCNDYVTCQTNMINAIDKFNGAYSLYLNNPGDNNYEKDSKDAADFMLSAVTNVTDFIRCNPKIVEPTPGITYDDILHHRQTLSQKTEMLKSMNGAPKAYNASNNIYDDYRISYNTSVYVSIMVCILAVFAIYFYFRNI